MTNEQLDDALKEEDIRDADPCSWCKGTGVAEPEELPNWPGVTSVRALVAEVRESKTAEQNLRDAIYRGHAGMSCKQIAEMADRNIEWCREAQVARDVARDNERAMRKERDEAQMACATEAQLTFAYNRGCDSIRKVMDAEVRRATTAARLWKALAQAYRDAGNESLPVRVIDVAIESAKDALRDAGIDPDAP